MHNPHYKVNTEESCYFFKRFLTTWCKLMKTLFDLQRRVKRNNFGSSNIVYTLSGRRILQSILATDHYSGQHPPFILFTTSLHWLHPWYWRNKPAQQQLRALDTNSQHDSDRQPADKVDISFPIFLFKMLRVINTEIVDWQFVCVLR